MSEVGAAKTTIRMLDPCTVRVIGQLGRRSSSFAFQMSTRMRWLGDAVGEHEIEFAKPRHARSFAKLQDRDIQEGVL